VRASTATRGVLVTSVDTARGLDFPDVDCVLVLGRAGGPDEYLHVAGRTGRGGASGTVVSVLEFGEISKLKGWETMLGIKFEKQGDVPSL
jgi:ATP-dependent RNA helicase DeaD